LASIFIIPLLGGFLFIFLFLFFFLVLFLLLLIWFLLLGLGWWGCCVAAAARGSGYSGRVGCLGSGCFLGLAVVFFFSFLLAFVAFFPLYPAFTLCHVVSTTFLQQQHLPSYLSLLSCLLYYLWQHRPACFSRWPYLSGFPCHHFPHR